VGVYEANAIALEIGKSADAATDDARSAEKRFTGWKCSAESGRQRSEDDTFYALIWVEPTVRYGPLIRGQRCAGNWRRMDCPDLLRMNVEESKIFERYFRAHTNEHSASWLGAC